MSRFTSRCFSPGPPVSSNNKTDHHEIAETIGVGGVKHHQRNKTNNLKDIWLMLSIRFDNISVFIVEYKEFAEKTDPLK